MISELKIFLTFVKLGGAFILAAGCILGIVSIVLSFCGIITDRKKDNLVSFAYAICAAGFCCTIIG